MVDVNAVFSAFCDSVKGLDARLPEGMTQATSFQFWLGCMVSNSYICNLAGTSTLMYTACAWPPLRGCLLAGVQHAVGTGCPRSAERCSDEQPASAAVSIGQCVPALQSRGSTVAHGQTPRLALESLSPCPGHTKPYYSSPSAQGGCCVACPELWPTPRKDSLNPQRAFDVSATGLLLSKYCGWQHI